MNSFIKVSLAIGLIGYVAQASAADIAHDAEYYVLEKQNGEQWSLEDTDLDQRMAAFRKKMAANRPIFSTY
jgi:hypothetical protein